MKLNKVLIVVFPPFQYLREKVQKNEKTCGLTGKSSLGVAVLDGYIYAIGGFTTNSVERYFPYLLNL